jgi:diguanylate cyclase (GGDEF)-like protein
MRVSYLLSLFAKLAPLKKKTFGYLVAQVLISVSSKQNQNGKARIMQMGHLPRRYLYPLFGAVLAMGSPLGLLLLQLWQTGETPTLHWALEEIRGNGLVYGYLIFSTTLVFLLLGYFLGNKEDELYRSSSTDPLTGLCNRRLLTQRAKEEIHSVRNSSEPLSLLVMDIDRFKHINDSLGHDAGDEMLKRVATILQATARGSDVAARFGGDEFVLLLPRTNTEGALQLARRIQSALAKETQPLVSLSIGLASVQGRAGYSIEKLFVVADEALYQAKAQGRDRIVVAKQNL